MPSQSPGRLPGLLLLLLPGVLPAAPPLLPLGPAEAETLALDQDPLTARYREQATAREESAISAGALPDPMLIIEWMDLPAERPRLEGDDMTQFRLGLRQTFPRGDSRALRSEQERLRAMVFHARAEAAMRETRAQVCQAYVELHYQRRLLSLLEASRDQLRELLEVTEREFAAGRGTHQTLLETELALENLADRLDAGLAEAAGAQARLARWIGAEAVRRPLPDNLPELPTPNLTGDIDQHPLLRAQDLMVTEQQRGVTLARQGYRPEWSVELTYGTPTRSGMNDADRLSAMVMLDLPLFTRNRQDRDVAASLREAAAAGHDREAQRRELRQSLTTDHAAWQQLAERERRYRQRLLPLAEESIRAAEEAYAAGTGDLPGLVRARINHLELQITAAAVTRDRWIAQVRLLSLLGEDPS
ncbi:TolC family protein [Ectothiorhodospira shaposhnikovii]|uniref:TolC family protein n=1 Tax=Ectothiorhodospira shaposhnikovii TaxID=1054 RepID=UPI0039A1402D